MKEQKDKYHALKALFDQDGGKALVASLLTDVQNCVEKIASGYKVMTHEEFISVSAELSAKLTLARELTRAEKNEKYVDTLILESLQ
jgi:hypothetical protein